jgi:hypothetical protein
MTTQAEPSSDGSKDAVRALLERRFSAKELFTLPTIHSQSNGTAFTASKDQNIKVCPVFWFGLIGSK